ncbi:hypothetical protein EVAR_96895_1 [Eumeta japonica]|uniref:Uncharacterized protein n=1 Tax=Eumeta variegata TaxID=151549 RepID=A0A4C1WFG0_EUMVA|nr:hypothetical protein EVAR_96895_1 [Eumeta japonica]
MALAPLDEFTARRVETYHSPILDFTTVDFASIANDPKRTRLLMIVSSTHAPKSARAPSSAVKANQDILD